MASVLIQRVQEKSQISWHMTSQSSAASAASFSVFLAVEPVNPKQVVAERFRIFNTAHAVYIYGDDEHGLIFGIGKFLRLLSAGWSQSYSSAIQRYICMPSQLLVDTKPQYPIRGHQIAYRAAADSYGGALRPLRLKMRAGVIFLLWICGIAALTYRADGAPCSSGQVLLPDEVSVVLPQNPSVRLLRMASVLIQRVQEKSQISWHMTSQSSAASAASFSVFLAVEPVNPKQVVAERFRIFNTAHAVYIYGDDEHGLIFGIGKFLRLLSAGWSQSYSSAIQRYICMPSQLLVDTKPQYPIRGHQIAYRAAADSYGGWTFAQMERYIEDLVIFGTNTIECVFLDGNPSPQFVVSPKDMIVHMSRVSESFGLNFSIWYPSGSTQFDPSFDFIRKIPRIDSIFVPGGDPGSLSPAPLFQLIKNIALNVRKYHPHAQLWVSAQGFNSTQMTQFYDILNKNHASYSHWLTGVAYGPHTRDTVHQERQSIPLVFPIRYYPDICHGLKSQFPSPLWGPALGLTEQREVITPRPLQHSMIVQQELPPTVGFVTYSDGVVDDVNKFIWSIYGWNSSVDLTDALLDYSNTMIDSSVAAHVASGIANLEQNWLQSSVGQAQGTLELFESLINSTSSLSPRVRQNWRFQSLALRAHLDFYILQRKIYDQTTESDVLKTLATYSVDGPLEALQQSLALIQTRAAAMNAIVAPRIRQVIMEYAALLFQSINLELSTSAKYQNIGAGRGAILDFLDNPLSNKLWLSQQINTLITNVTSNTARVDGIRSILNWTNPGPGGFYDDLGSIYNEPHLVRGPGWQKDPSFYLGPVDTNWEPFYLPSVPILPFKWYYYAEAYYDQPVQLSYRKLNPAVAYQVKVVYSGDTGQSVKLVAQSNIVIHDYIVKPNPPVALTFPIPRAATSSGSLTLSWYGPVGQGGSGRAQQIAEVWLQVVS
eukprot:TRINITY_DN15164_c0_g1_i1.p1 TRINITY_DN15164_c0_g1~~TRINITY_DN15164_c0_g1_i1.p1  ORF type:complete len:1005 (-),score=82.46 TRINITY_DN15164_c0_g1_i1:1627-4440(-)